jgi:RNA-directed DNA polymerase
LITHIEKGFDFLGQNIRRYPHGKLFIKPARKSVVSVLAKVKQIVREYLGSTAHLLNNRLNPIVRGWANYHRHVVSKRVFARLDAAIFRMLWGWAHARHHRKGAGWIKQKYFDRVGTRDWWFFGDTVDARGSPLRVSLVSCSFCANRKACEGSVRPESLRPELDSVSVQTLRRRSASCAFMI